MLKSLDSREIEMPFFDVNPKPQPLNICETTPPHEEPVYLSFHCLSLFGGSAESRAKTGVPHKD